VIFREGGFDALPQRILHLAPWQGLTGGETEMLIRTISRHIAHSMRVPEKCLEILRA
jgi:hypothetical protein